MGWKFPEIPRPHSVVHLHYLEHFGASVHNIYITTEIQQKHNNPEATSLPLHIRIHIG